MKKVGQFVTVPEAARRTGLSEYRLRRACQLGELRTYNPGGWIKVDWREVQTLAGQPESPHAAEMRRRIARDAAARRWA